MTRQQVTNHRKILCLFPKHANGFATFNHAFRFFPDTVAFMPPQGMLTIAAYLPESWEVRFIDENVCPASDDDYRWADAVLASGMHAQRTRLERIAARAHKFDKLAVLGGPSVSACPEFYPDFDILHVGEIGDATDKLIQMLDRSVERPAQQVQFLTIERLPLDDFPIPAYHLIKASNYLMMNIQWSSGCPYSCEFCDIPALYGRNPRTKSPERLLAELDVILRQDPLGAVFFVDDNLIGNKKAAKQLLPHLVKWQKQTGYRLRFLGECTLNLAQDRELLSMMREAYFTDIFFGVESPEEDALIAIDKYQNTRMPIREAVKVINSYGIGLHAGIILGLDTDDEQTVQKMNNFIDQSKIPALGINVLYAPPKTPLWRRLEAEGRLIPTEDVVESNVVFKEGEQVVMGRWAAVIGHAFDPAELFERLRYNVENTYPNRLQLSLRRMHLSWNLIRNGLFALMAVLLYLGILAPYRRHFWRLALAAVRVGQIDALVYAATISYHLIRFRDEVLAGQAQVCIHSEARGATSQEVSVRPSRHNRYRSPQLRMAS
jgi:radical SAM superfamily enzyme YgiQ (UPF0313 family)